MSWRWYERRHVEDLNQSNDALREIQDMAHDGMVTIDAPMNRNEVIGQMNSTLADIQNEVSTVLGTPETSESENEED